MKTGELIANAAFEWTSVKVTLEANKEARQGGNTTTEHTHTMTMSPQQGIGGNSSCL